jgi:hypothetical protein
MKRYLILIAGLLLLTGSFVWMAHSCHSVGPFTLLAVLSGAVIAEGIAQVRRK